MTARWAFLFGDGNCSRKVKAPVALTRTRALAAGALCTCSPGVDSRLKDARDKGMSPRPLIRLFVGDSLKPCLTRTRASVPRMMQGWQRVLFAYSGQPEHLGK